MDQITQRQMEIFDTIYKNKPVQALNCDSFCANLKGLKIKRILKGLDIAENQLVLDVGCGRGDFLKLLCLGYGTIGVGIDISMTAIRQAKGRVSSENRFAVAEAERLPFPEQSFDLLLSLDVLEHVASPGKCIAEMSRILKSGGKILLYVLNRRHRFTWHWWLEKLTHGRCGIDHGQLGEHNRDNFLDPNNFCHSLELNNLKVRGVIYFHAFFSLIIDEGLAYIFQRYKNKKSSNSEMKNNCIWLPVIKKIYSLLLLFSLELAEFFDRPLAMGGYSNGFFVIGQKID